MDHEVKAEQEDTNMDHESERRWKRKRKRSNNSFSGFIPEDIISDVLSRLSVDTLMRFQLVCKSWNALISSPHFISSHYEQAKKKKNHHLKVALIPNEQPKGERQLLLYTNEVGSREATLALEAQLFQVPKHLLGVCHCNGLLLIPTAVDGIFVCNPTTREMVSLPNGTHNRRPHTCPAERAGFGLVPRTGDCKVARFFNRSFDIEAKTCSMGFQVFTIGVDSSWRAIEDPPYPIFPATPACVDGAIYWMVENRLHTSPLEAILRFDLSNEKFELVPPPCQSIYGMLVNFYLVEVQSILSLVFIDRDEKKVDMWMYKNDTKHSWVHSFRIDFHDIPSYILPFAIKHGKLLLVIDYGIVSYDPQSKLFDPMVNLKKDITYRNPRKQSCHIDKPTTFQLVPYVESLVKISKRGSNPIKNKWSFSDSFWRQFKRMLHNQQFDGLPPPYVGVAYKHVQL